ncbi:MAG: hypothetical protein AB2L07_05115 [Thermoanaerobaculaceae bacterium]
MTWTHPSLALQVTAFDSGEGDDASYILRYRVTNRTARRLTPTVFAAVRPLQVNPLEPVPQHRRRGRTQWTCLL